MSLRSLAKGGATHGNYNMHEMCGHSFELSSFAPIGESHKVTILQCSTCGTPVGLLDGVSRLQMKVLQDQITSIDNKLTLIAKALTA